MSQNLVPTNGGRTQIEVSPNYVPGIFLSPQYTAVKDLGSVPTEWVPGGRPIYDRLPAASERYKLYFGLDEDTAYVYIPLGNSYSGTGSVVVQSSGENKYLTVQSGVLVWKYGEIPVDPVIINLQEVDMRSTRYLLAYQLFQDDSPFEAQYTVEDYSLSGQEMEVGSATDTKEGWRYPPVYAFTNLPSQAWRNYDGFFPDYSEPAYLYWQTELPNSYSKIKLRCSSNATVSGTATLYYQSCPNPVEGETYCSNPEWLPQYSVTSQSDSQGQYFEFSIPNPNPQYGWKVQWSDPKVSIYNITVSGTITLKRKPSTALTYCKLVAYPENAVPKTAKNASNQDVPVVMCDLAYVDINNSWVVEKITDIRKTVNTPHQPIADWLTKPWDENLIRLHTQVQDYPNYWLNPGTCVSHEYAALSEYLINVEK